MKDSTRNALALFAFGLVMFSISPLFSNLINYDALFSIFPSFFSIFFNVQELRWGTVAMGSIVIVLGLLTVLYNWRRK